MLDVLISKNLYRAAHCKFFSFEKEDIDEEDGPGIFDAPDQSFDGVVMAGVFSKGHLPISALKEVARILKPGKDTTSCVYE